MESSAAAPRSADSDFDGFEDLMTEEAIRRSLSESPLDEPDLGSPVFECEAFVESQPGQPGRGRISGKLRVFEHDQWPRITWVPADIDDVTAQAYKMSFRANELRSIRAYNSRTIEIIMRHNITTQPPVAFKSPADQKTFFKCLVEKAGFVEESPGYLCNALDARAAPKRAKNKKKGQTSLFNMLMSPLQMFGSEIQKLSHGDRVSNLPTFYDDSASINFDDDEDDGFDVDADDNVLQPASMQEAASQVAAIMRSSVSDADSDAIECREADTDGFGVVDVYHKGSLPERQFNPREDPISLEEFRSYFEGTRCTNELLFRERLFRGGLHPDARPQAWKFLLGYWPGVSHGDNKDIEESPADALLESFLLRNRKLYRTIKQQWTSMTRRQLRYNTRFRELAQAVKKDVHRTDRDSEFFSSKENLVQLHDILMTYGVFNADLGYVQGMSDIAGVMLYIMRNEADAFWCFANWMDHLMGRFNLELDLIKKDLDDIGSLLVILDPEFMRFLRRNQSDHMLFCFRWLLIFFKREFAYDDAMIVWETIWSRLLSPRFEVFIALSMLDELKQRLAKHESASPESILLESNEIANTLDVQVVLQRAEAIWTQLRESGLCPRSLSSIMVTFQESQAAATAEETSQNDQRALPNDHTTRDASSSDAANTKQSSSRSNVRSDSESFEEAASNASNRARMAAMESNEPSDEEVEDEDEATPAQPPSQNLPHASEELAEAMGSQHE